MSEDLGFEEMGKDILEGLKDDLVDDLPKKDDQPYEDDLEDGLEDEGQDEGVLDEDLEDEEDVEEEEDDLEDDEDVDEGDDDLFDIDDVKTLPKGLRKSLKKLDKEERAKLIGWIDARLQKARVLGQKAKEYESKAAVLEKDLTATKQAVNKFAEELGKTLKEKGLDEKVVSKIVEGLTETYGTSYMEALNKVIQGHLNIHNQAVWDHLRSLGLNPTKWAKKNFLTLRAMGLLFAMGHKPVDVFRILRIDKPKSVRKQRPSGGTKKKEAKGASKDELGEFMNKNLEKILKK